MRLLSCHIENFGILHDLRLHFEEDLTPVLEENGWGKTTLAAFLTAMFYGLPASRGSRGTPGPRTLYMPWSGGTFGGSLLFEAGSGTYRIVRAFGDTPKKDIFLLYDERTGYESEDFSSRIGEELFGIDRESFLRTASFSSGDSLEGATPQVQARIGGLAAEEDDLSLYEKAMGKLVSEERRLSPDRASGELNKKSQELDLLAAEENRIPSAAEQVRDISEQLQREQQLRRRLVREQEELLTRGKASSAQVGKALQDVRKNREEVREDLVRSESRLDRLQKLALFLSTAGGVLLLSALLAAIIPENPSLPVTAVLTACAVLSGVCAAGSFVRAGQLNSLIGILKQTEIALTRKYRRLKKLSARPQASEQERNSEGAAPLSPARADRLREISKQLDSSRKEEMLLADRLREARSVLSGCEEAAARRKTLLSEYESLQEEYLVCTQTARFLRQARDSLSVRCMDPFRSALVKYYCSVTDTSPDAVRADASMDVTLTIDGIPRDPSSFSAGMRDLLGFCRRMAILEAMYPQERPLLVMDDPFSGLDDEHLQRALRLVREISETWQVLYFTCHSTRLP